MSAAIEPGIRVVCVHDGDWFDLLVGYEGSTGGPKVGSKWRVTDVALFYVDGAPQGFIRLAELDGLDWFIAISFRPLGGGDAEDAEARPTERP
jgi:hypothetical protein